ncbi:MAG: TIGR02300 family protein [Rubrimonas sp.]|uniref:TIGR02300 family protein n=1 Tax=Rubrimonas sp. TaxID=2036015 RepID=UPI002FDDBDB6
MVKPEWGVKRLCASCGARFYDLNRNPVACPDCGAAFDLEALVRGKRPRAGERAAAKAAVAVEADLVDDDVELDATDDDDDALPVEDDDDDAGIDADVVAEPDEEEDDLAVADDVLLEDDDDEEDEDGLGEFGDDEDDDARR